MIILRARSTSQIRVAVEKIFAGFSYVLPEDKNAKVFIKINANSDMIGLTGNTTDLRLVVEIIKFLQNKGYKNIFVGDGTSSGFQNTGIDCLKRLCIRKLAKIMGVTVVDLNSEKGKEIEVLHHYRLKVAKICFEADLFIDLPKLKTHGETQMSCCLKSKIGCVVGLDKQIVHRDLAGNILELNRFVKPHLHVVDAILPMEGLGPSRGIPKNLGLIMAGVDPLLLDLAACAVMGRQFKEIPYLLLAKEKGLITSMMEKELKENNLKAFRNIFRYPDPSILQRLINHPFYRLFFVKIRYAPALFQLLSSGFISKIMYFFKLRQDLFVKTDGKIRTITISDPKLINNTRLDNYCPMGLAVSKEVNSAKCLHCLYCFFVDKRKALTIEGELNHWQFQIDKYKPIIEEVAP